MCVVLSPVVQKLERGNTIHRMNHYPVDKCYRNYIWQYPLDKDLLDNGKHRPPIEQLNAWPNLFFYKFMQGKFEGELNS